MQVHVNGPVAQPNVAVSQPLNFNQLQVNVSAQTIKQARQVAANIGGAMGAVAGQQMGADYARQVARQLGLPSATPPMIAIAMKVAGGLVGYHLGRAVGDNAVAAVGQVAQAAGILKVTP